MGDKSLQLVGVADGLGAAYAPLELLYTNTAVVFGIVYVFLPFMILPVYAAMERFDRLYLEAALDLGAGALAHPVFGFTAANFARRCFRCDDCFCSGVGRFFYRRNVGRHRQPTDWQCH